MYKIVFTKQAYKSIRKIPKHIVVELRQKLDRIAEDPYTRHANVTKLQNRPGYRLRIGDWRVIYDVNDDVLTFLVIKIGSRGEIYR